MPSSRPRGRIGKSALGLGADIGKPRADKRFASIADTHALSDLSFTATCGQINVDSDREL